MKKLSLVLLVLFAFQVVLCVNTTAQSKPAGIDKVVMKLQAKVLLSNDQTTKVKSIITSYINGNKSSENLIEAQRKISALLDEKQKAKYDIIKNDWWQGVNKTSKEE